MEGLGTGDATNGYTDYSSLGQFSLSGSFVSTANKPPVPVVTSTAPVTGTAPVTVNFSSAGSSDPDGTIVAYDWDFGDGTGSTSPSPSRVYTAAGTYLASLVVYDNGGLSAVASLSITVTLPPQPPVAVTSATTPTNGFAPLAVTFSSAGSYDLDGTIKSYKWAFSDRSSATTANVSKTFSTPGTYTGTLTVTDNSGRTGSSTVTIVVKNPKVVYVSDIKMTVTGTLSTGYIGQAQVTVRSVAGALVGKASVVGNWSGLAKVTGAKASTGTSGATLGVATLKTSAIKKAGSYNFTVTKLSLSGYTYDPKLNVKSWGSIATP